MLTRPAETREQNVMQLDQRHACWGPDRADDEWAHPTNNHTQPDTNGHPNIIPTPSTSHGM